MNDIGQDLGFFSWFYDPNPADYYQKMSDRDVGRVLFEKMYKTHRKRFPQIFSQLPITIEDYFSIVEGKAGDQLSQVGASIKMSQLDENEIDNVVDATLFKSKGQLPESASEIIGAMTTVVINKELVDNFVTDVVIKTKDDVVYGADVAKKLLPYFIGFGIVMILLVAYTKISMVTNLRKIL